MKKKNTMFLLILLAALILILVVVKVFDKRIKNIEAGATGKVMGH